jgi:hypothetical protein
VNVSTFDPFVTLLWQWLIGSCEIMLDPLDPCFWQGFVWWMF